MRIRYELVKRNHFLWFVQVSEPADALCFLLLHLLLIVISDQSILERTISIVFFLFQFCFLSFSLFLELFLFVLFLKFFVTFVHIFACLLNSRMEQFRVFTRWWLIQLNFAQLFWFFHMCFRPPLCILFCIFTFLLRFNYFNLNFFLFFNHSINLYLVCFW